MEMIEVKTAELIGPALDWAVGYSVRDEEYISGHFAGSREAWAIDWIRSSSYSPSTEWAQGGPLINKYQVALVPEAHDGLEGTETSDRWYANVYYNAGEEYTTDHCDTALIAACRAVVATAFGDTVSVPKELMQ